MANQPAISLDLAYIYLDRAQQLLKAPRDGYVHSWIKHTLAVDSQEYNVPPESDLAVAYCEIGAIRAVTHYADDPEKAYSYVCSLLHAANPNAIAAITGRDNQGGIPIINDASDTNIDKVLNMFERAKNLALRLSTRVPTKN